MAGLDIQASAVSGDSEPSRNLASQAMPGPAGARSLKFYGARSPLYLTGDFYPAEAQERAQLVVVSGLKGHARWFKSGPSFAAAGISTLAYDRRGSGRSEGLRGHAAAASDFIDDFHAAQRELRQQGAGPHPLHVLAHSFGARTALAALKARASANWPPPPIASIILLAPALYINKDADFSRADKLEVLWAKLRGRAHERFFKIKTDSSFLTEGPDHRKMIDRDPYRLDYVSAAFLWAVKNLEVEVAALAASPLALPPLLLVLGVRDRIVQNARTLGEFYERYPGPKTLLTMAHAGHLPELDAPEGSLCAFRNFLAQWMIHPNLRVAHDSRITI